MATKSEKKELTKEWDRVREAPYGLEKWCYICKRWKPRKGNFTIPGPGRDGAENRCNRCRALRERARQLAKAERYERYERKEKPEPGSEQEQDGFWERPETDS